MKNPASRAFLMLRVLILEPKAGMDTGSSILLRVVISSERRASAVCRAGRLRYRSWHHFSTQKSEGQEKRMDDRRSQVAEWLVINY